MSSGEASSESARAGGAGDAPARRGWWRRVIWERGKLFAQVLYGQIDRDHTFSHAAALTYKTLFSLLPIFVLTLLILSVISAGSGSNALDVAVKKVMFEQLSLNKLTVVNKNGEEETLADRATKLIDNAKESVNSKLTGLIAFGVLVYGALSLMVVIESTFNLIYGGAPSRSWPRRIMLYWCVLTLGPIGVAGSIAMGNSAYVEASNYVGGGVLSWMLTPVRVFSGLAVSYVLVVLMYRLIPGTAVKWKSALVGGLVGAVLWELCKWGFGVYVQWSLRKASWYGPLAILPLFMLWIYLTWSSILIGLHVAYLHQYYPLLKRQYYFKRMGRSAIWDLRAVLPLGVLLYRHFKEGKAVYGAEAAERLMLPHEAALQLLVALEDAGVVQETRGGGFVLAKPATGITAYDLLAAVRTLARVPAGLVRGGPGTEGYPQIKALAELEELETKWGKGQTLAGLAGEV